MPGITLKVSCLSHGSRQTNTINPWARPRIIRRKENFQRTDPPYELTMGQYPFWRSTLFLVYFLKFDLHPSLNTQSCNRRPLCSTFRFEIWVLALKNPVFSTFSNLFNKKLKKIIKAILCNFSVRLLKYLKKKILNFFCPPKHEKTTLKSCS